MNNQLSKVMEQAIAENQQHQYNEIGTLIIDIERAKRTLWAFGNKEGNGEFLNELDRVNMILRLLDMDVEELKALNSRLEAQINGLMTAMRNAKTIA